MAEAADSLENELRRSLRGDVSFDAANRAVYATDSSNYRHVPIGVVFPRDHDDVVTALRICAAHRVPVVGRGGGTSLAGQACNAAVVVDTSRYLTKILSVDPEKCEAVVQAGVVLDDLRRAAEVYGLTFGPDPATHAWCTFGGMIGNNSCGTHGVYAGKTVDNIARLRVVTYGGTTLDLGAYDDHEYARAVAAGGALAPILGGLRELAQRNADLIRQRYPDIPRRVSGFNLDQLLPENGFHVARALVGTESTCVFVTEATVQLSKSPRHRRLVVLGYPHIFDAADAVPSLMRQPLPGLEGPQLPGLEGPQLLGLEGFDQTLVDQMLDRDVNVEHLELLPEGHGWLLAELGDDDPARADELADAFVAALPAGVTHRRYDDPVQQRRLWLVRESGLGATAIRADGSHNAEGWEDAAVPIANLGTYLRRISKLWAEFGYSGAWYGHFGQGCVHTRNNFDLHTEDGRRAFRSYVEQAADLVVALGGSLSGEHGDGQARGELLTRMFGPELVDAFRQFKAIFDPASMMNPGKVVDAYPLDANLKFGSAHRKTTLAPRYFAFAGDRGSLQVAAERCVGVGRCRRDDSGVMCPSYRATRDERHSTRGRAKLLAEMFQGEVTPATWRNREVREALDLCLSCKGCVVDCPTHVDMATYKAEFFAHHYARRLRPRAMYALGLIPWAARLAAHAPVVANFVLTAPGLGTAVRRLAGVTTNRPAPRFARISWRRAARAAARRPPSSGTADATVVVWPDTFTDAYRPWLGQGTVAVLEALGEQVALPTDWACCGRPLYDMGMLGLARRWLTRALDILEPWLAADVPVVVIEPSCLAAFRDELPGLLAADPRAAKLAALARSPAEHVLASHRLSAALAARPAASGTVAHKVALHPHCHARADGATPADVALLERLGYEVELIDGGCCGLAGSFGFDARHEPLSRRIGEDHWMPRVRAAIQEDVMFVTDGFSCATQSSHLQGPVPRSTIELLCERFGVS